MSRSELLNEFERHLVRITRVANSRAAAQHRQTRSGVAVSRLQSAMLTVLEAGDRRVTDLAVQLDIEVAVASREVRVLVDRGLVTRLGDPDDARASLLHISRQGRAELRKYRVAATAILDDALTDWDDDDLREVVGYLRRLAEDFSRPPR